MLEIVICWNYKVFDICNISCIIRGPSCRRVVIVLIRLFYERLHCVVLFATSIYLSFAGEKTIGEFLVQLFVNVILIDLIIQSVHSLVADLDVDLIYILL